MKRALFILLLAACSDDVPSGARSGGQAILPVQDRQDCLSSTCDDHWWIAACGEVMPLRVGHSVTPPRLLQRVEPQWPAGGVSGIFIIETVVDVNGTICDARVLKGLREELDAIALAAVKQWRFRPALLNGVPRAAVYTVSVKKRGADL